jgi:hypothetical protein
MLTILFILAGVLAQPASASTILSVQPYNGGTFTLGAQFLSQALLVSWTSVDIYSDVSITVDVEQGDPPLSGVAYLTTRIGPGTTPADEVATAPFIPPAVNGPLTIFTGLDLDPGTYYLILYGPAPGLGAWAHNINATIVTGIGVTRNPDLLANEIKTGGSIVNLSYPPASTFGLYDGFQQNMILEITGEFVPEPGTLGFALVGLAVLAGLRRAPGRAASRRRSN